MKKDELLGEEKALLLYCLKKHAPGLVSEIDHLEQLNPDKINDVREAVGDELIEKGIDEGGDKINEYGLKLDDLIDKVADLYLWPKLEK